tara:strand:- start:88 stop:267 length:180 start_codon:yes stop_codon:yes gene_type:complete
MSKKKRYNFTLDEDLMMWFKVYCKENRLTASAAINNQLFKLYRQNGISKPLNTLPTKSD